MTNAYERRLVALAKEVEKLNNPQWLRVTSDKEQEQMREHTKMLFVQKLNHLLGYILALDEEDKPECPDWFFQLETEKKKCKCRKQRGKNVNRFSGATF